MEWAILIFLVIVVLASIQTSEHKAGRRRGGRSAPSRREAIADASYTMRGGRSVRTDAVFDAWTSGDLDSMISVLHKPTRAVDRHHLLVCIVDGTYKQRADPQMAALCVETAETFLEEFPTQLAKLRREWRGFIPSIPVFQKYATLLTEQGDFDRAVEVCQFAIDHGIHDGTASGFEGRIARIEKARAKAIKPKP